MEENDSSGDQIDRMDFNAKFSDYFDFIEPLGSGSFAHVVKARDKKNNQLVAVKIISKRSVQSENYENLRNEAEILASLDHKNIVKLLDVKETDTNILIVMKLINGSLQRLMIDRLKRDEWFTEREASTIMKCLLSAVSYIHDKNIIHRDLKPENILIDDNDNLESIKVADFGLSKAFGENIVKAFSQQCGTLIFMAPEQFVSKVYSKPIDLLTRGSHPFYESGDSTSVYIAKMKKYKLQIPSNISNLSKSLIDRLLKQEPQERYSAGQALLHPWITGKFEETIPMTIDEMQKGLVTQQNMSKIIKTVLLMSFLQKKQEQLKSLHIPYIEKCIKLSNQREIAKQSDTEKSIVLDKAYLDNLIIKSHSPKNSRATSLPNRTHLSAKYLNQEFVVTDHFQEEPVILIKPISQIQKFVDKYKVPLLVPVGCNLSQKIVQQEDSPFLETQVQSDLVIRNQQDSDNSSPLVYKKYLDDSVSPNKKRKKKKINKLLNQMLVTQRILVPLPVENEPSITLDKRPFQQRKSVAIPQNNQEINRSLNDQKSIRTKLRTTGAAIYPQSKAGYSVNNIVHDEITFPDIGHHQDILNVTHEQPFQGNMSLRMQKLQYDAELNKQFKNRHQSQKKTPQIDRDQIKPFVLDIGSQLINKTQGKQQYFPIHNYPVRSGNYSYLEMPNQNSHTNEFPPQKIIVNPLRSPIQIPEVDKFKFHNFINNNLSKRQQRLL